MSKWKTKSDQRVRRHLRVRNKIEGTALRPRMSVFRSNKHISVQFIDDLSAVTLASVSTQQAAFKGAKNTVDTARDAGIETVVFDRAGFRYSGRVAALADAAREGGLNF
jgi:large subunit ribosomal protein L18